MAGNRDANGYFSKGNKLAKGRPKGARNKPPAYPFMEEGDTSAPARRFRTLIARMADDLGGTEALTAGQGQLIKRCAMISVACELMEQEAMTGQQLNASAYGVLTGHLDSDAERSRPQTRADRRDPGPASLSRHATADRASGSRHDRGGLS